ncbi:glycoside hydrolase family 5 protein [Candidatus Bathyarchaeota archaeon]|nr:glycoside hydrolase family 5 protein [Candidatus Bathyarchaeota archaeon]
MRLPHLYIHEVLLLLFLATLISQASPRILCSHPLQTRTSESEKPTSGFGRGVNIGNALEAPEEGAWGVYIKDEYFRIISEAGFNIIRIPIRWSAHAEEKSPYKINDEFFGRVDHVISKALEQNLTVIINVHHYEEIMLDPQGHWERFLAIWRQISEHYKNYPKNLYFELLNEPHGALTSDLWNALLLDAVKIIRETNPTRKIVIGPVDWNSVHSLKNLSVPDDENIIVTFHLYTPFEFTHQGAEWVTPSPPVGRKWLGTEEERKQIINELDIAAQWAREHGEIPLLLGEFGAYSKADMNSRVRWTYFVAREAEKRGIAWCYWEFCAGFGVYDPIENRWREDLLNALIPKENTYYVSAETEHGEITGSGWYYKGTYATIKLKKTEFDSLIPITFDHFEGLNLDKDIILDKGTVKVYVDGPREVKAIWRRNYTKLAAVLIAGLTIGALLFFCFKRLKRSKKRIKPDIFDAGV